MLPDKKIRKEKKQKKTFKMSVQEGSSKPFPKDKKATSSPQFVDSSYKFSDTLPDKKFRKEKKPKKTFERSVQEGSSKPFPKDKKGMSSPQLVVNPSLKQLFESRKNASKGSGGKSTPTCSPVIKKRKSSFPAVEKQESAFPPTKKPKFAVPDVEEKSFPRGGLRKQQFVRQEQRQRKKVFKQRLKQEEQHLEQTVFVGNLPITVERKHLEKLFGKFGNVLSARIRGTISKRSQIPKKIADITSTFHEGLRSRKGFVVFKETEAADAALALSGTVLHDHHITVDKASAIGQRKTYDDKRTVFVGNLAFDVDDESVWNAFSPCGEVEAVRVIRDPNTGAGKGFGYVLFRAEDSKAAILERENVTVNGRIVRIKSVEGNDKGSKQQNFARGAALKAKSRNENPQSRKSVKKLMKKAKARHDKKKVADNFKKFF